MMVQDSENIHTIQFQIGVYIWIYCLLKFSFDTFYLNAIEYDWSLTLNYVTLH